MLARKALAGTAGAPKEYVEDVFQSWLYVGNGSTQTITNNIDLSTKGGLVWTKGRNFGDNHGLYDTARGATKYLSSNLTGAEGTFSNGLTAFNSNGYSLGADTSSESTNANNHNYVSWTFRKAKKFFDVVTYTGNGTAGRTISHNLGSVPGCIIVKNLTTAGTGWIVYHRSLGNTKILELNTTAAEQTQNEWNNTDPTSTVFSVYNGYGTNRNGDSYVAYLFAHDAGGFGDAGSDSIIKCGSFATNGSGNATVDLGWEPQWLLIKTTGVSDDWWLVDNMRAFGTSGEDSEVARANASTQTIGQALQINTNSTGFSVSSLGDTLTRIYIAIRKGPMKTPETGTSVFTPTAFSGNDTSGTRSAGLNAFDLLIAKRRGVNSLDWVWLDKLRGLAGNRWLTSDALTPEAAGDIINTINGQYTQDGINITKSSNYSYLDSSGNTYVWYALKRAPKFFDEVCYTGTGSNRTITHNLGVVPELMIVKCRGTSYNWGVYSAPTGATKYLLLHSTAAADTSSTPWNNTDPTSSVFTVGTWNGVNASSENYVAYLFASLSGISKIGTYTGNGSSQTINCGFSNGARFILIKRTDSTGDWYVYDSARGIVSGNDPQLKLNSTAAEATGYDAVDPDNSGFIVNNDATNFPINVNNATYIYLAIA